mgnify:CR=1 FL=1
MSDTITYEQPLNERLRTLLRLEALMARFDYCLPLDSHWDTHCALVTLMEIFQLSTRGDLKSDLMKELDRQIANLSRLSREPDVDQTRLEGIIDRQRQQIKKLHDMTGQLGRHLKDNDFINALRQRTSIPGGTCDFDLPAYHHWLSRPVARRREQLELWITPFREVQEAIDMAAFASGLSRQLYGKTMTSERPEHRLYEQWHPLGPVGIITAFNFPMAVWSWNALIAATCGDSTVWKPSSKVPLCAIAVQRIVNEVLAEHGWERGVACLACGTGRTAGMWITRDDRIPLVSATGSVAMGRRVSETVAGRIGRTILELGGNNAVIVSKSADLDQAVPAIVFGAVGTAGQRCTSIRRLIVHESVRETLVARLVKAYSSLTIGDPLDPKTRMGPLIDTDAVSKMQIALESARDQGGTVLYGGKRRGETFVDPAIVEVPGNVPIVAEETFAPILYVMAYEDFDEALWLHNDVPQGLSSSLFSTDLREVETFLSHRGSDCGIANVNVSTSGAEIGAAFGGEKETGGGREAGSDAWKAYMRRQSVTTNWGAGMPLSQGIDFSY